MGYYYVGIKVLEILFYLFFIRMYGEGFIFIIL